MTSPLRVAYRTDVGARRSYNEDSVLVQQLADVKGGAYVLAVADGVGGAAGGATASHEAVEAIAEVAARAAFAADPGEGLKEAFLLANSRILALASSQPELQGMATTLTVAAVIDGRVWLANVGDSRAYLLRAGSLSRLTEDHSWVMEQVRAGSMTEAEARVHPRRNIITRAVGTEPLLQPDLYAAISLEPGDAIICCSDGLHSVVDEVDIAAVVSTRPVEAAVEGLIDRANSLGGPDNITVIIASFPSQTDGDSSSDDTVRTGRE